MLAKPQQSSAGRWIEMCFDRVSLKVCRVVKSVVEEEEVMVDESVEEEELEAARPVLCRPIPRQPLAAGEGRSP